MLKHRHTVQCEANKIFCGWFRTRINTLTITRKTFKQAMQPTSSNKNCVNVLNSRYVHDFEAKHRCDEPKIIDELTITTRMEIESIDIVNNICDQTSQRGTDLRKSTRCSIAIESLKENYLANRHILYEFWGKNSFQCSFTFK